MIKELVKLANHLDSKGLIKEADYLDRIIKMAEITGVRKAPEGRDCLYVDDQDRCVYRVETPGSDGHWALVDESAPADAKGEERFNAMQALVNQIGAKHPGLWAGYEGDPCSETVEGSAWADAWQEWVPNSGSCDKNHDKRMNDLREVLRTGKEFDPYS